LQQPFFKRTVKNFSVVQGGSFVAARTIKNLKYTKYSGVIYRTICAIIPRHSLTDKFYPVRGIPLHWEWLIESG